MNSVPTRLTPEPKDGYFLVRMKRPDGSHYLLQVPEEHLQRVMDLAAGQFGDPSIDIGGPELPPDK